MSSSSSSLPKSIGKSNNASSSTLALNNISLDIDRYINMKKNSKNNTPVMNSSSSGINNNGIISNSSSSNSSISRPISRSISRMNDNESILLPLSSDALAKLSASLLGNSDKSDKTDRIISTGLERGVSRQSNRSDRTDISNITTNSIISTNSNINNTTRSKIHTVKELPFSSRKSNLNTSRKSIISSNDRLKSSRSTISNISTSSKLQLNTGKYDENNILSPSSSNYDIFNLTRVAITPLLSPTMQDTLDDLNILEERHKQRERLIDILNDVNEADNTSNQVKLELEQMKLYMMNLTKSAIDTEEQKDNKAIEELRDYLDELDNKKDEDGVKLVDFPPNYYEMITQMQDETREDPDANIHIPISENSAATEEVGVKEQLKDVQTLDKELIEKTRISNAVAEATKRLGTHEKIKPKLPEKLSRNVELAARGNSKLTLEEDERVENLINNDVTEAPGSGFLPPLEESARLIDIQSKLEVLSVMHPPNNDPIPETDSKDYVIQLRIERDRIAFIASIENKLAKVQTLKMSKEIERASPEALKKLLDEAKRELEMIKAAEKHLMLKNI